MCSSPEQLRKNKKDLSAGVSGTVVQTERRVSAAPVKMDPGGPLSPGVSPHSLADGVSRNLGRLSQGEALAPQSTQEEGVSESQKVQRTGDSFTEQITRRSIRDTSAAAFDAAIDEQAQTERAQVVTKLVRLRNILDELKALKDIKTLELEAESDALDTSDFDAELATLNTPDDKATLDASGTPDDKAKLDTSGTPDDTGMQEIPEEEEQEDEELRKLIGELDVGSFDGPDLPGMEEQQTSIMDELMTALYNPVMIKNVQDFDSCKQKFLHIINIVTDVLDKYNKKIFQKKIPAKDAKGKKAKRALSIIRQLEAAVNNVTRESAAADKRTDRTWASMILPGVTVMTEEQSGDYKTDDGRKGVEFVDEETVRANTEYSKARDDFAKKLKVNLYSSFNPAEPAVLQKDGRSHKGFLHKIPSEDGMEWSDMGTLIRVAKEEQVRIVYSEDALAQLSRIQILDTLFGKLTRSQASLRYMARMEETKGEQILLIKNVMADRNEGCFDMASPEDISVAGKKKQDEPKDIEGIGNQEFSSSIMNGEARITLPWYDPKFALAFIKLYHDIDFWKKDLKAILPTDRRSALIKRYLRIRNAFIKDLLDKKGSGSLTSREAYKYNHLFDSHFENGNPTGYVVPSFLRHIRNGAETISEQQKQRLQNSRDYIQKLREDEPGHSETLRRESKKGFLPDIDEDKITEPGYDKKFADIIAAFRTYATMHVVGQNGFSKGKGREYLADQFSTEGKLLKDAVTDAAEMIKKLEEKEAEQKKLLKKPRAEEEEQKRTLKAIQEQKRILRSYVDKANALMYGNLEIGHGEVVKVEDTAFVEVGKNDDESAYMEKGPYRDEDWIDKTEEPLFAHEPCAGDVVMGGVGDCYVHGVIAAFCEKSPKAIKEMMRDNGKTVTVRFYKDDKRPVYVTVSKKIPSYTDMSGKKKERFARGVLWVQMLEKAYVASGLASDVLEWNEPKATHAYSKIGNKLAMEGKVSYDCIASGIGGRFMKIMAPPSGVIDGTFTNLRDREGQFVNKGKYEISEKEEEFWEDVKKHSNRIVLTVGTRSSLPGAGTKGLNNETVVRGIVLGHHYTVLGIRDIDGEEKIELRNPWGYGTSEEVYDEVTGAVSVQKSENTSDDGSFFLSKQMFFRYFLYYSVTVSPENAT